MGQLKLEVLIDVMRTPYLQHCEARISDANIGTVLQAVDMLPILAEVDDFRLPRAKNCTLHAILFHSLGGYNAGMRISALRDVLTMLVAVGSSTWLSAPWPFAGILPPPPSSAAARTSEFAATRMLSLEAARFRQRLLQLSVDEAQEFVQTPLTAANCCLLKLSPSPSPPPPPPPPPPPSSAAEAERDQRRLCRMMLARGAHARYGALSPLRELASNRDLLEKIASMADLHPGIYIPSPPPKERHQLLSHLRKEHAEKIHLREQLGEAHVRMKCLQRERDQAARHAMSALANYREAEDRSAHARTELEQRLQKSEHLSSRSYRNSWAPNRSSWSGSMSREFRSC